MSMTTPIVDFVQNYAKSGTSRLHMPGHKGQALLGFEGLDITEIRGADELYEADGIIAQSEANATRLFGTAHTYYSTEGSSQCIRAMLCLALPPPPPPPPPAPPTPPAAAAADSLDGTYDITVWVSEMAGVKELTEQQIKDFMEEMGILSYEDLEDEDFTTLGGLAMFLLGGIPKAGDIFTYKNLQFEVVDMDRGRVDKLLVIKRDEEQE